MSLYGRIFASFYDRLLASAERAGLAAKRHSLLARARGRVLEIGAGTGLNLAHYPAEVGELVLAEPDAAMAARLRRRVRAHGLAARVVEAHAEDLPFADAAFDTIVCTLVLCTVDDPACALAEVRRVLAPQGQLLFLEHVRADDPGLARWQDRLAGLWRRVGRGCRPNRATATAIEQAGFRIAEIEHDRIPKALPIVAPLVVGRALPA